MNPSFTRSWETQELINNLLKLSPGDFISYTALDKIVKGQARPYIQGAKTSLAKEGIVFETVRGEGLKRIPANEVHKTAGSLIATIRRRSRRLGNTLAQISTDGFTPDEVKAHHAALLHTALIHSAVSPDATKRLPEVAEKHTTFTRELALQIYG